RGQPRLSTTNTQVMAGDKPAQVVGRHAAIAIADWDGDGKWDILSGTEMGGVVWFRNVGTRTAPPFDAEQSLIPKHSGNGYPEVVESGSEPEPGYRTQVAATDYDRDGKIDLLVGDFRTTKTLRPDLTAEERAEWTKEFGELEAAHQSIRDGMKALITEFD